ncbi:MAG TPA: hypothetical protein PKD85_19285 [Saprospiraceae bacterium]|nr:hypothetical protein [Saprospiraceae bacterium]
MKLTYDVLTNQETEVQILKEEEIDGAIYVTLGVSKFMMSNSKDVEAIVISTLSEYLKSRSSPNMNSLVLDCEKIYLADRLKVEIPYRQKETKKWLLSLSLRMEETFPTFFQVYLKAFDKVENKTYERFLFESWIVDIHSIVGTISIKQNVISIKPRKNTGHEAILRRYRSRGFDIPILIYLDDFSAKEKDTLGHQKYTVILHNKHYDGGILLDARILDQSVPFYQNEIIKGFPRLIPFLVPTKVILNQGQELVFRKEFDIIRNQGKLSPMLYKVNNKEELISLDYVIPDCEL